VEILSQDIERLASLSELFTSPTNTKNAAVVVSYWQDIYQLMDEEADLYERLVQIQGEYWRTDLNKAISEISIEEREAMIGGLNYEASDTLEESRLLYERIEQARDTERLFWSESFEDK
jgi:hypothetical protein